MYEKEADIHFHGWLRDTATDAQHTHVHSAPNAELIHYVDQQKTVYLISLLNLFKQMQPPHSYLDRWQTMSMLAHERAIREKLDNMENKPRDYYCKLKAHADHHGLYYHLPELLVQNYEDYQKELESQKPLKGMPVALVFACVVGVALAVPKCSGAEERLTQQNATYHTPEFVIPHAAL